MVLVIEDDQAVRDAMQVILEMAGFEVLVAQNGREGVALFTQNQEEIEVVLLDITMPVMGGEQVMREMFQQDPEVKIILSSGHHQGDIGQDIAAGQPAGFLHKPYDLNDLVAKVIQVIN